MSGGGSVAQRQQFIRFGRLMAAKGYVVACLCVVWKHNGMGNRHETVHFSSAPEIELVMPPCKMQVGSNPEAGCVAFSELFVFMSDI